MFGKQIISWSPKQLLRWDLGVLLDRLFRNDRMKMRASEIMTFSNSIPAEERIFVLRQSREARRLRLWLFLMTIGIFFLLPASILWFWPRYFYPGMFLGILIGFGAIFGRLFTSFKRWGGYCVFFDSRLGRELLFAVPDTASLRSLVHWHGYQEDSFELHWSDGACWKIPGGTVALTFLRRSLSEMGIEGYALEQRPAVLRPSAESA